MDDASNRLVQVQGAVGGPIKYLVVQGVNRQPELRHYVGKSIGQIAEEEGKHVVDVMLDLSIAGGLNVEFLGPERPSSPDNVASLIAFHSSGV